jgi:tyrosinase
MSSNGEFIPGRGDVLLGGNGLPEIPIPAGTGGGCIKSGPFKDMKVNIGPVALGLTNGSTVGNGDGLDYNPRCLQRDLTDYSNKRWANATSIVDLILRHKDIESFQMEMQGVPGSGAIGVHGGGKYKILMYFAHTKSRQVTIQLAATPVVISSRRRVILCSICIMAVSTAPGGSGSN